MQTSGANRQNWKEELKDMTTQIFPTPCVSLPPDGSAKPISVLLFSIPTIFPLVSAPLLITVHPFFVTFAFIFPFVIFLSLPLYWSLCSTESNGDRPSPTGLCWRPTLRRWSVSPTPSTLSLPPSVPLPLRSPFWFVTWVDTVTGRDNQMTSQLPPGEGCFTLGFQKGFSVDLIIHPHKEKLYANSTLRAEDLNLP